MDKINKIEKGTEKVFYIATSLDKKVVHYGINEIGEETVSGQPILKTFLKESEYLAELKILGIELEKI